MSVGMCQAGHDLGGYYTKTQIQKTEKESKYDSKKRKDIGREKDKK